MEVFQHSIEIKDSTRQQPAPAPLSILVKKAVDQYFSQLNGYDANGLYEMVISEVEKPLIEATLTHTGHNQTKAAMVLGLSRSTLRKKMDHYNIS